MVVVDVAKFSLAIEKVYKDFSQQEVFIDRKELKGLSERGTVQYYEQRFQAQLQRARNAFLQEYRNHSVVVENEVKKIRDELTEKLEEKYGQKIIQLKRQMDEESVVSTKQKDQITHLQGLVTAQESYLTAVRHRWGLEQSEKLRAEIQVLNKDLEKARREKDELEHHLMCRDDLVLQLRGELTQLEDEMKKQVGGFTEEKRACDDRLRSLRAEMKQQQEQFKAHLKSYEEQFAEYRSKTEAELQIQDILNSRRSEALGHMEEERQRHIKARTKPSRRIGPSGDEVADLGFANYDLHKATRYRVDPMGMDESWRDYKLNSLQTLAPPGAGKRSHLPKFKVERATDNFPVPRIDVLRGPNAPVSTDVPSSTGTCSTTPRLPTSTFASGAMTHR